MFVGAHISWLVLEYSFLPYGGVILDGHVVEHGCCCSRLLGGGGARAGGPGAHMEDPSGGGARTAPRPAPDSPRAPRPDCTGRGRSTVVSHRLAATQDKGRGSNTSSSIIFPHPSDSKGVSFLKTTVFGPRPFLGTFSE